MSTAPHRAYRLKLDLEADTIDALESALRNIGLRAVMGELTSGVSGGVDSGHVYELTHDPTMTAERYQHELRDYVDGLRNADSQRAER